MCVASVKQKSNRASLNERETNESRTNSEKRIYFPCSSKRWQQTLVAKWQKGEKVVRMRLKKKLTQAIFCTFYIYVTECLFSFCQQNKYTEVSWTCDRCVILVTGKTCNEHRLWYLRSSFNENKKKSTTTSKKCERKRKKQFLVIWKHRPNAQCTNDL